MGHGAPDFGNVQPKETTFRLDDLAEAVVRLGSIVSFDRLGDVLFLEGFEDGINRWRTKGSGVGSSVVHSDITSRNGKYCMQLTAGSTLDCYRRATCYIPYPVLSNFGLEMSISLFPECNYILFKLKIYDGANYYLAMIKYDVVNSALYYLPEVGAYVEIKNSYDVYLESNLFSNFKLVVDFVNKKYKRLIVNNRVYSLEGISLYNRVDTTIAHIEGIIELNGILGENGIINVDDVIITQNEP
jgi:hypothetical protein